MYKGKLSLYTPTTVALHETWKSLRKICEMVNVIRYRGSTSGSSLPGSLGRVYEGLTTVHNIPLGNDQVKFGVIESSNWSLIFCVSYSRSSGAMDVDVQKLLEVGPKYCLIVTPTPAALTRLGCSGCPMVVVSTS